MSNKTTSLHVSDNDGKQLSLQSVSTDSPILPAENLAKLQAIDPELVKLVIEETRKEANHRRILETRRHWFVYTERIAALLLAFAIALSGLVGGYYAIAGGQPLAGSILFGGSLVLIVNALLKKDKIPSQVNEPQQSKKPARKRKSTNS